MSFPGGLYPSGSNSVLPLANQDFASPFSGFSNGMSPSESSLNVPDMGSFGLDYKTGGQLAYFDETIPIVRQYLMADGVDQQKADTLYNHLLWVADPKVLRQQRALDTDLNKEEYFWSLNYGKVELPTDPRYDRMRSAVKAICLSRLNRFFKSKEGRSTYGVHADFKKVRKVYKFAGVDRTELTADTAPNDIAAKSIAVGGRVRIPDFSAMSGKLIRELDAFYIVWRRMIFTESTLDRSDVKKYTMSFPDEAKKDGLFARIEKHNFTNQPKGTMVLTKSMPGKLPASTPSKIEYYWEGTPWCGERGTEPNVKLYRTSSFLGDIDYIGLCTHLHRESTPSPGMWPVSSRDFICPTTDTDKWKEAGLQLGTMVLQLRRK